MGRHKVDAAALEERARVHAARIEQQDDELAQLRRKLAVADAEHQVQGAIIRRRNTALVSLASAAAWLLAAAAGRPERVLDTGTPGVEVAR
jgi:hypothetical protein